MVARRKFVEDWQDRKLIEEMIGVLDGMGEEVPDFFVRCEGGETVAEAFTRLTGVKLMPWQKRALNEL